jgi:hypothetical protein
MQYSLRNWRASLRSAMQRVTSAIGVAAMCLIGGLIAGCGAAWLNGFQFATGSGERAWVLVYLFFVTVIALSTWIFFAVCSSPHRLRQTALYLAVTLSVGLSVWMLINQQIGTEFVHP